MLCSLESGSPDLPFSFNSSFSGKPLNEVICDLKTKLQLIFQVISMEGVTFRVAFPCEFFLIAVVDLPTTINNSQLTSVNFCYRAK